MPVLAIDSCVQLNPAVAMPGLVVSLHGSTPGLAPTPPAPMSCSPAAVPATCFAVLKVSGDSNAQPPRKAATATAAAPTRLVMPLCLLCLEAAATSLAAFTPAGFLPMAFELRLRTDVTGFVEATWQDLTSRASDPCRIPRASETTERENMAALPLELECDATLAGHSGTVRALFAVDGGEAGWRFVSGSSDKSLRIWDAAGGEELRVLQGQPDARQGHTDAVYCATLLPPAAHRVLILGGPFRPTLKEVGGVAMLFASGSFDDSVRLWDAAGEKLVLSGHAGTVDAVSSFTVIAERFESPALRPAIATAGAQVLAARFEPQPSDLPTLGPILKAGRTNPSRHRTSKGVCSF